MSGVPVRPAFGPRRPASFPGENPQPIRCPQCGRKATTSEDGIIFICTEEHLGYYERSFGEVIPEDRWRP